MPIDPSSILLPPTVSLDITRLNDQTLEQQATSDQIADGDG